jgi:hypothetical protein
VKRSTAIGHLVEMAGVATDGLRWRGTPDEGAPLELWVAGELLDAVDTLEFGAVVMVLDLAPAELPWLHRHAADDDAAHLLGLGKRPLFWAARPRGWPAWNPTYRRVARYWSADEGLDEAMIDALRQKRFDDVEIVAPTAHELREQCERELSVSRDHLRAVLERYWDDSWRRQQRGRDRTPDDTLWRAAKGLMDLQDVLDGRS